MGQLTEKGSWFKHIQQQSSAKQVAARSLYVYLFLSNEGWYYVFWTQNNCCKFHASHGIFLQSVHLPLTKQGTIDMWDVALPRRSLETSRLDPTCGEIIFFYHGFCFRILPVLEDFSFCLHSSHGGILKIWSFSLHSRVLFLFCAF